MSFSSQISTRRAMRKLVLASLAAALPFAAVAPAHANITTTIDAMCDWPGFGPQSVTFDITAALPNTVQSGEATGAFDIDANIRLRDSIPLLFAAPFDPVTSGTVNLGLSLESPTSLRFSQASLTIPPTPRYGAGSTFPIQPVELGARGTAASLNLPTSGPANLSIRSLSLTLHEQEPDGASVNWNGGTLDTFTAPCTISPPISIAAVDVHARSLATMATAPGTPTVSDVTQTTARLQWAAASGEPIEGYDIFSGTNRIASLSGAETSTTLTHLVAGTNYGLTVTARNASGVTTASSDPVSFTTDPLGGTPPTTPGTPVVTRAVGTTARFTFAPSSDDEGLYGYTAYVDGVRRTGSYDSEQIALNPFVAGTTHTFQVRAWDRAGNASDISDAVTFSTATDVVPPSIPGTPVLQSVTSSSAAVTWGASTDDDDVVRWEIDINGAPWSTIDHSPPAVIQGLHASTQYSATVRAIDPSNNKSDPSQALVFTTANPTPTPTPTRVPTPSGDPVVTPTPTPTFNPTPTVVVGPTPTPTRTPTRTPTPTGEIGPPTRTPTFVPTPTPSFTPSPTKTPAGTPTPPKTPTPTVTPTLEPGPPLYTVSGSATLKSLVKGSLPLKGSLTSRLNSVTGDFSGDLSLSQTTANLTALGFLPVVARVNVVPTEAVTGQLTQGSFTAKVRIKLPSITVFGVQLAGGASCQTTQASTLPLKVLAQPFSPTYGGTLGGSFSISNVAGCGALTGLVSPLTASSGNSILLKLAPPT